MSYQTEPQTNDYKRGYEDALTRRAFTHRLLTCAMIFQMLVMTYVLWVNERVVKTAREIATICATH